MEKQAVFSEILRGASFVRVDVGSEVVAVGSFGDTQLLPRCESGCSMCEGRQMTALEWLWECGYEFVHWCTIAAGEFYDDPRKPYRYGKPLPKFEDAAKWKVYSYRVDGAVHESCRQMTATRVDENAKYISNMYVAFSERSFGVLSECVRFLGQSAALKGQLARTDEEVERLLDDFIFMRLVPLFEVIPFQARELVHLYQRAFEDKYQEHQCPRWWIDFNGEEK